MHSPLSDLCQRSIFPFDCGKNGEVLTCVMPEMRMNSLKSRAMNCGPLSEMIRGRASGCFSLAAWRIISISGLPHAAAEAIEHAGQVVIRPCDVDRTHVDMPMLWLL